MVTSGLVSPHTIELVGRIVAIVALLLILANATLVDRVPPAVQSITLGRTAGDAHVGLTHTTIDVEFTKVVDQGSAQLHFRIAPAVQGTFAWEGGRTMIFTPAEKLPVATQFTVSMAPGYRDPHGNVADQGGATFSFRTVGLPVLTSSTPADGASDVAVDAPIALTFDRLMDVGATQSAVSIQPTTPFRATWSGSTVTLTPLQPLSFGTPYVVTVSQQAADSDGNSPARPIVIAFTTVRAGLALTQVVPADGSAGAPVDGPIVMVFDGPVDPSSVTGLVRITPPASGDLRVETLPDDNPGETLSASILVYQPSGALAAHTTYTVELLDGVQRADDPRRVAAGRTWSFTTGAPTDSLQNQVLFLSARTGVRNLWAMNPDGSNPRQLTDELAPVTAYDVTADGKRVVYAAGGLVKTFRLGDAAPTVLTPDEAFDYVPRLVPDGSAVIVGRRGRLSGQDEGIWLLPIESSQQPRQLLPTGAPPTGSVSSAGQFSDAAAPGPWTTLAAVSPAGRAALVRDGQGEIEEIDLASGGVTAVGLHDPSGPMQWSDRERGFVVDAAADGEATLAAWLIRPAEPPVLLGGGGPWLSVSPQGAMTWLAGMAPPHVVFQPTIGGLPEALTTARDLADREPSFSPAGDIVIFVRAAVAGGPSAGIWEVRTDGRDLRQLAPDGSQPRWLP